MRHNNNNNQQVVDHYVTAILWTLAITIILILLFNAENIAEALVGGIIGECGVTVQC